MAGRTLRGAAAPQAEGHARYAAVLDPRDSLFRQQRIALGVNVVGSPNATLASSSSNRTGRFSP